jgi:hypothetical protein
MCAVCACAYARLDELLDGGVGKEFGLGGEELEEAAEEGRLVVRVHEHARGELGQLLPLVLLHLLLQLHSPITTYYIHHTHMFSTTYVPSDIYIYIFF